MLLCLDVVAEYMAATLIYDHNFYRFLRMYYVDMLSPSEIERILSAGRVRHYRFYMGRCNGNNQHVYEFVRSIIDYIDSVMVCVAKDKRCCVCGASFDIYSALANHVRIKHYRLVMDTAKTFLTLYKQARVRGSNAGNNSGNKV